MKKNQEHPVKVGCDSGSPLDEAHRRFDAAGVPDARGMECEDPTCKTRIGHRIKLLIQERDTLRELVKTLSRSIKTERGFIEFLEGKYVKPEHAE